MKIRFLAPFIWLAALAGITLRTVQLYFFFDSTSGFLHDSGLFSILLAVLAIAAALIPTLYMRRHELIYAEPEPQPGSGVGAILAAAGTLTAALLDIRQLLISGSLASFAAILAADGLMLIPLCALAAGHFRGEPLFNGHTVLGLLPILSLGIRAIYLFAVYTPINSSFVNLLNLSALACQTAFFCSLAYLATDKEEPPRLSLLLCGCAAAVTGLSASAPQLICLVLARPCPASANPSHLLQTAALSVYTLFFLPSLRVKQPNFGRRFRA